MAHRAAWLALAAWTAAGIIRADDEAAWLAAWSRDQLDTLRRLGFTVSSADREAARGPYPIEPPAFARRAVAVAAAAAATGPRTSPAAAGAARAQTSNANEKRRPDVGASTTGRTRGASPAASGDEERRARREEWLDWATGSGRIAAASREVWARAYDRNAGAIVRQLRALPAARASAPAAGGTSASVVERWRAGEISLLDRPAGSLFGGGS